MGVTRFTRRLLCQIVCLPPQELTGILIHYQTNICVIQVFLYYSMEYGMGMFGMASNSYIHEGCVFEQPLLAPNEALEPVDDEETLRMDEPTNNIVEPLNNVALDIYTQELPTLNFLNSAQVCVDICYLISSFCGCLM